MSIWSKLLNIGSLAAIPFTGGASAAGLGLGGALKAAAPALIGGVASGLAAGKQKGREAENAANMDAAQFAQREAAAKENSLMGRAGLDLQQRGFQQQSQGDAYKKALQSALAMNMQDVNIELPSRLSKFKITGGERPSAIGPEGKAAAAELQKQAMMKLMNGEKFDPLPAYQGTAAPQYKKPGFWENLLGGVGMGANAVNTAMGAAEDKSTMQQYIDAIQALSKNGQPPTPFVGDVLPGNPNTANG